MPRPSNAAAGHAKTSQMWQLGSKGNREVSARTGDDHRSFEADGVRHGEEDLLEDEIDDGQAKGKKTLTDAAGVDVCNHERGQNRLHQTVVSHHHHHHHHE